MSHSVSATPRHSQGSSRGSAPASLGKRPRTGRKRNLVGLGPKPAETYEEAHDGVSYEHGVATRMANVEKVLEDHRTRGLDTVLTLLLHLTHAHPSVGDVLKPAKVSPPAWQTCLWQLLHLEVGGSSTFCVTGRGFASPSSARSVIARRVAFDADNSAALTAFLENFSNHAVLETLLAPRPRRGAGTGVSRSSPTGTAAAGDLVVSAHLFAKLLSTYAQQLDQTPVLVSLVMLCEALRDSLHSSGPAAESLMRGAVRYASLELGDVVAGLDGATKDTKDAHDIIPVFVPGLTLYFAVGRTSDARFTVRVVSGEVCRAQLVGATSEGSAFEQWLCAAKGTSSDDSSGELASMTFDGVHDMHCYASRVAEGIDRAKKLVYRGALVSEASVIDAWAVPVAHGSSVDTRLIQSAVGASCAWLGAFVCLECAGLSKDALRHLHSTVVRDAISKLAAVDDDVFVSAIAAAPLPESSAALTCAATAGAGSE